MGDLREAETDVYTMDEVRKHTSEGDAWIVVDDTVYDITNFWKKHPGGERVIMAFAGMDASAMYHLYHLRKETICDKYLQFYKKGTVTPDSIPERKRLIDKDYAELTKLITDLGYFKSKVWMQIASMIHVILLILLSIGIVAYYGNSWLVTLASSAVMGWAWVQSLYVFHDFGHRAVTHIVPVDYFFQHVFTNLSLGMCTEFTQVYHNLHHTFPHKTGAVLKTEEKAKETKLKLPLWRIIFNCFTTAPALFPYLWTLGSIKLSLQKRQWLNVFTFCLFHAWYIGFFYPHVGLVKTIAHWIIARQIWSHIVFFTALANHIETPPNFADMTFFEYQVSCSVNFTKHWFIDYVVGGQNEQIEHHLWPHMSREYYSKAAPYVRSLCKKWDIPYTKKTTFQAYYDVFDKLRKNPQASRPYDLWCQLMYRTS